jgi:hypothetical protein
VAVQGRSVHQPTRCSSAHASGCLKPPQCLLSAHALSELNSNQVFLLSIPATTCGPQLFTAHWQAPRHNCMHASGRPMRVWPLSGPGQTPSAQHRPRLQVPAPPPPQPALPRPTGWPSPQAAASQAQVAWHPGREPRDLGDAFMAPPPLALPPQTRRPAAREPGLVVWSGPS